MTRTKSATRRSAATRTPTRPGPKRRTASRATTPSRPVTARRTSTSSAKKRPVRTAPFIILLGIVVCFSLLGLTMVLSASSVTSLTETGSPWGEFRAQAMWLALGGLACLTTTLIDHRLLRRLTVPALIVSFVLLVMVLLPWFGVSVNGAQRWIRLGPAQFQPSEIAKLALVLFAADNLARSKTVDVERSLRPILIVLMAYGGLILMQPNLGTTIIIFVIGISTLFASGIRLWVIAVLGTLSAAGAGALAYLAPYRRDRLFAFLDPWSDPLDEGWQTIQSLVSVANGGVRGVGIGESRGKFGYLPEAHNDFVFAVTAEEFGLVGATVVVLGYVMFGLVALVVARRADRFGALLVIGIASWILVQAFINIGAVLGVLPITGVPLPFMSAGGTSLVTTLAGVGVMLNVARGTR
ncbi:MAG: putative lipid II flippase FtsW [Acidimicrobiia bacterium]|nr:putative lipid II flippase FtsW [Acidimicrobiia bacterium]